MKKYLKSFSFLLVLLLCLYPAIPARAERVYSEVPTSGYPALNSEYGSSFSINPFAYPGLTSQVVYIGRVGSSLTYGGETAATHLASQVGIKYLRLEYWDGYDWMTLEQGSYYTTNSYTYMGSRSGYEGKSGKYYRCCGTNYAIIDGVTYEGKSETGYIQIP